MYLLADVIFLCIFWIFIWIFFCKWPNSCLWAIVAASCKWIIKIIIFKIKLLKKQWYHLFDALRTNQKFVFRSGSFFTKYTAQSGLGLNNLMENWAKMTSWIVYYSKNSYLQTVFLPVVLFFSQHDSLFSSDC